MPQLRARSFRARHNTQLHVNCMPRLRPAASRNCGQQLHAATAIHCFHVVVITCVALRKCRASGRISLASSPGPNNTLMGIPFTHHVIQLWPKYCPGLISATAAMTDLWDSQPWHPNRNIYALRGERKRIKATQTTKCNQKSNIKQNQKKQAMQLKCNTNTTK